MDFVNGVTGLSLPAPRSSSRLSLCWSVWSWTLLWREDTIISVNLCYLRRFEAILRIVIMFIMIISLVVTVRHRHEGCNIVSHCAGRHRAGLLACVRHCEGHDRNVVRYSLLTCVTCEHHQEGCDRIMIVKDVSNMRGGSLISVFSYLPTYLLTYYLPAHLLLTYLLTTYLLLTYFLLLVYYWPVLFQYFLSIFSALSQ